MRRAHGRGGGVARARPARRSAAGCPRRRDGRRRGSRRRHSCAEIRRAAMLSGDLGAVAHAVLTEGGRRSRPIISNSSAPFRRCWPRRRTRSTRRSIGSARPTGIQDRRRARAGAQAG
jgi:hypothetical protein